MESLLERLLAIESVSAAVLARKNGAIVSSTIDGEDAEALGALGAAAFDSAVRYVGQLSAEKLSQTLFETASGAVQVGDLGDTLIIVRSAGHASLGRIRLEIAHAVKSAQGAR
jgi:predicted regulator of Ras-like GTPase activity (Roadblock/LC7/MglB family)